MLCLGHGLRGGKGETGLAEWDAFAPYRDRLSFQVKCRRTPAYNCIAWAAGDQRRRWDCSEGNVWPVRRARDAAALQQLFEWLGYEVCSGPELEAGYVKVALYATDGPMGEWQHAARQLPDGRWSSKCGSLEGVIHATPQCVEGRTPFVDYGRVYRFMRMRTSLGWRLRSWLKRLRATLSLCRDHEM